MSESAGKTLGVAAVLCGVCSVLVAGAVVILKPQITHNAEIDFKKNILMSAGLLKPGTDINKVYGERVESAVVNLETGEIVADLDPATFKEDEYIQAIPAGKDLAGLKRRASHQVVYLVKEDGKLDQIVLHISGKGLWSTMKGFLSLANDAVTVRGFNYYSHAETPGLGGEVDNPKWIAQWPGKKVYNESMQPAIDVLKSAVPEGTPNAEYKIDGLSGATITANGVEKSFLFWLSDLGYKKFLENVRSGSIQ